MAKKYTNNEMLVVVRIYRDTFGEESYTIFSKSTTNKEKMMEYFKEQTAKYPKSEIRLMGREDAHAMVHNKIQAQREEEARKLAALDKKMDAIYIKYLARTLDQNSTAF